MKNIGKQSRESVLEKKKKVTVGRICRKKKTLNLE